MNTDKKADSQGGCLQIEGGSNHRLGDFAGFPSVVICGHLWLL
jgi:hypothetical protein